MFLLGYVDIGLIPEGARDIRIEEVAEAGNFLALRSDNPNKYFLNGGWTIQWNGDYKAAGTIFTYERTGHLENLTSPGPTTEPLWIQVRLQPKAVGHICFISKLMNNNKEIQTSLRNLCTPASFSRAKSRRALRVHDQSEYLR